MNTPNYGNKCKCGNEKDTSVRYCTPSCNPRYGKKRPSHSKLMKKRTAMGLNASAFKRGHVNSYINTVDWKRTVLSNRGIEAYEITDDEVVELHKQEVSKIALDLNTKKSKLISLFDNCTKHPKFYLTTIEDVDDMEEYEIDELLKIANSIKTLSNRTPKCGAKKFKRELIRDLKYNINGVTSVYTRSSYEGNFIRSFERNKINWHYEPFNIPTDTGYYVPDFVFIYRGQTYMIEVKGYFVNDDQRDNYFENKIQFAIDYCKENNIKFIFTYMSDFKNITDLLKENTLC